MYASPTEQLISDPAIEGIMGFTDEVCASYYPLYLFIPYELLFLCSKEMQNIPRRFLDLIQSDRNLSILHRDWFYASLMNCYAFMVWQIIRQEYKLHPVYQVYSFDNPILLICGLINYWKEALEEAGILPTKDKFLSDPYYLYHQFGYQTLEQAIEILTPSVLSKVKKYGFDRIIETIKEYPCHEDFSNWHSNPRRNFERKWYHQRSKYRTESLEALQEEYAQKYDGSEWDLPDEDHDYENEGIVNNSFNRFMRSLEEKDRRIIHLRMSGYTYAEIAHQLGYKDHTAVLKRIKKLRPVFREFMDC